MRTVADILATKTFPINLIQADKLVVDALRIMKTTNLSYVIVMNGDDFAGIFSERDYARNVALEGKTSATCKVSEAMATGMPQVSENTSVAECMELILDQRTRYLPVMEKGNLEGVITIHDILREVVRSKGHLFDNEMLGQLIEESGGIY